MFQLISVLRSFLKELFFNSEHEANFNHHKFNLKKWCAYMLVLGSFAVNFLAVPKLVELSVSHTKLEEELTQKLAEKQKELKEHIENHHLKIIEIDPNDYRH